MSSTSYSTHLENTLRSFLDDPRSFSNSATFLDSLHDANPRKATHMGALPREQGNYTYFCTKNGEPAVFRFCAMVDRKGQHSKTDAYFNIANHNGETIFNDAKDAENALGRLRVAVQARALSPDDNMAEFYPEGAIERSNEVIGTIALLQQEFLEATQSNDSNITRCVRVVDVPDAQPEGEDSRFDIVLTSHLLLPGLRQAAKAMPKISRSDLTSGVPLSPSKLRSRGTTNAEAPSTSSSSNTPHIALRDLDDPTGVYAMCDSLLHMEVVAPRIFNGKGDLVHPNAYDSVPRACPALIEATLCCMKFKPKGEDEKAITHLRLQSIHLLDPSLEEKESTPGIDTPVNPGSSKPKRKHGGETKGKAVSGKKPKTRSTTSNASSSTAKTENDSDEEDEMAVED